MAGVFKPGEIHKAPVKMPVTIWRPEDPRKIQRQTAIAASRVKCGFCSMRGLKLCEFPSCGRPFCAKHGVTTGTTQLCRDHREFAELKPAGSVIE